MLNKLHFFLVCIFIYLFHSVFFVCLYVCLLVCSLAGLLALLYDALHKERGVDRKKRRFIDKKKYRNRKRIDSQAAFALHRLAVWKMKEMGVLCVYKCVRVGRGASTFHLANLPLVI